MFYFINLKKIKIILIASFLSIFLLFSCITVDDYNEDKIPYIETIRRIGVKVDGERIFQILSETIVKLSYSPFAYYSIKDLLNSPNSEKVFIIDYIEYNEKGLATKIEGHIEIPATYREYILKGGLGIPVYEAIQPNEFGVVFGRDGDIAIRDGVVVKENILEKSEFYEFLTGSELYDEFSRLALLSQLGIEIRRAFLKNYIVELEGMLLNSDSKKAIIESMKNFKKKRKNNDRDDTLLLDFIIANKSYLKTIKDSDKRAKDRIKKSRELLNIIEGAITAQSLNITKIFARMTLETLYLIFKADDREASYIINNNIYRNIPKNINLTEYELKAIQKYSEYLNKKTNYNIKINRELDKKISKINREIFLK